MLAVGWLALCCGGVTATVSAQSVVPVLRIHDGAREVGVTLADIAALPHRQLRIAGENSSDTSTVSGVALWDLLQKVGIPSPEASGRQRGAMYVRLAGTDGQAAMFALAELDPGFTRKTVLVAEQRDGRPLDGTEGRLRVFVPDDIRHARWIRGLARIDAGTLPTP